MKTFHKCISGTLVAIVIALVSAPALQNTASADSATLDYNEETHLIFMRFEEKLARDVYQYLGMIYPAEKVFGNIVESELRHTEAVVGVLAKYGVSDPSTNDNIGVYTSEAYGDYFDGKYEELTSLGLVSEVDAYKVGALIEELDMHDINLCPEIIVAREEVIDGPTDCGRLYTDNDNVYRLLTSLLEASENHLRAFVRNIEKVEGYGSYTAQYLTQEEVDEILGR